MTNNLVDCPRYRLNHRLSGITLIVVILGTAFVLWGGFKFVGVTP